MQKFNENIEQRLTARHRKCFQFCGDIKDKEILDVGCSFGWFEKMAVESGVKRVAGIEPNKEFFYLAKKEVPNVEFKEGSALKIPFEDNSFDVVVSFDVIEHLPDKTELQFIKEAKRVLRPGGKLVISTPFYYWLANVMDPAWWLIGHRHYKEKELTGLFEANGFEIEKTERKGGIFELASAILMYVFKWFFRREVPFKKWFESKRNSEYLTDEEGYETLFISAINSK